MSTQLAELEVARPVVSGATALQVPQDAVLDTEHQAGVARGIVNALLIATPFWVLFAFALYLLI
jgi:hypothetical protein